MLLGGIGLLFVVCYLLFVVCFLLLVDCCLLFVVLFLVVRGLLSWLVVRCSLVVVCRLLFVV